MIILIKSLVNKNENIYYYDMFLEKDAHKDESNMQYFKMNVFYQCHILIELTFLKELMLLKQVHQKSVIFVTIGIAWIIVLSFNQMSAIDVIIY